MSNFVQLLFCHQIDSTYVYEKLSVNFRNLVSNENSYI